MASRQEELAHAVACALAQDWAAAHDIAQRHEGDAVADWLHAVLHKIEGDDGNARYWYRRTHTASMSSPTRRRSWPPSAHALIR